MKPNTQTYASEKKRWYSFTLSLLTHAALIGLVLFFIGRIPRSTPGDEIRRGSVVLAVQSDNQTEYLTESETDTSEASPSESADAALAEAMSTPPPIDLPEVSKVDLPGVTPVDNQFDANQLTEVPRKKGKHEYTLSEEDLKMIKSDQSHFKNQEPPGPAASISVFGTGQLEGRRFVFVIDRSKSMGSGGLGVIDQAHKQLTAAIAELKTNHWFQVVAYNDFTAMIDRREMLRATEENKKLLPDFMNELISYGATNHENGLTAGLLLKPDVLVFMTDGGYPVLNGNQMRLVKQMSRRKTTIHTLQFGSGPLQENDNFMMELARQNAGTFRYINVNSWK